MSAPEPYAEAHLWPVTAFRVRLQVRMPLQLDPFERVVLELAAIGQADPVAVADMTGLGEDFVRAVVAALMTAGSMGTDRTVTDRGRRRLDERAEPQVIQGWMLRDDISGRPLPTFLERLGGWPEGVPTLAERGPGTPGYGQGADWMRPFVDWRQRRPRGPTARDAAVDSVENVSVIGDGVYAWMPVDLEEAEDGRGVRIRSRWDVASDVLEARLADAPSPPEALRRMEARAAERRLQFEAIRADDGFRSVVESRLSERLAGRVVPHEIIESLEESENTRHLSDLGYIGHAALLTQYRRLAEVVAGVVAPQSFDPLERSLSSLPKSKKDWEAGWRSTFESLAAPETLAVPPEALEIVASFRTRKSIPNHGQPVLAWPFVAAILAPKAPTTHALRTAAKRFPSLWVELESLRRTCNPSAHGRHRATADEAARADSMVVRIIDALFPAAWGAGSAPTSPVTATAAPESWRRMLGEAAEAESRAAFDGLAAERALRLYCDVAQCFLNELAEPPTASHRAALAALSADPEERVRILRQRMDGLSPPDDDGCGFELHESLVEPLRALANDLDTRGLRSVSRVVWPLVAATLSPGDVAGERVCACLAADRDCWRSFSQVSAALASYRPGHDAAERLRLVAQAREAIERLLDVRRTAAMP